jgi:NTP pyrophosphatase (non-canonical NTP hydrolase)
MMVTFAAVESEVIRWAEARKIIPNSTPVAQARKTLEEAGELLEAAAKLKMLQELQNDLPEAVYEAHKVKVLAEYSDAVGDVLVTLTNGAALADVVLTECYAQAYETIKDRKGTLLPNGIFRKES